MPTTSPPTYPSMQEAILSGDERCAAGLARAAIDSGLLALDIVEKGFIPGVKRSGELWEAGEYFLPELVASAQAMKAAMEVLRPHLETGSGWTGAARVVIGTVKGDIHDIGKSLVAALLSANGFLVFDEGVDVPVERFVTRAREVEARIICASALLTTTMGVQRQLVAAVRSARLDSKVLVGGAPVNLEWATSIGADGYADSAVTAVTAARRILMEAAHATT